MELSDYREKIDSIDKELVKLFAERMDTAAEIARYKKEHGMKVLDSARERAKLNDIASARSYSSCCTHQRSFRSVLPSRLSHLTIV